MNYIGQFKTFLLVSCFLFVTACAHTDFVEQQSETVKEGIAFIPKAIDNGRIDEVDSVSQSLALIFDAPKKQLVSVPVLDPVTGQMDIILPARLKGKVVLVNSPEYKELLKNKTIVNQLSQENKELKDYKTAAEKQKIADQKVLNDLLNKYNADEAALKAWHKSIFFKAYVLVQSFWFALIGGTLLSIIAVVLLCVFCPAVIPAILSTLGTIIGTIIKVALRVINGIFLWFGSTQTTTPVTTQPTTTNTTTVK